MKILYISYYFLPYRSIGGQRAYGQYEVLKDAGNDVKVITCASQRLLKDESISLDDNSDIIYMHSIKDINLNSPRRFQRLKSYILSSLNS